MSTPAKVPFNRVAFEGSERAYIAEAIANGHVSGDGPFTKRCHAELERVVGSSKALLTTSCTHALEMAALLLDIEAGDEVVLPTFTFVSTANAFVLRGAKPVFADSRPDTLNMDERQLPDLVGARTRAIVPVHYGGVGCEMDAIQQVATGCNAAVVEDNAHGLFGKWRGRPLGSFGAFATQSFHETKNLSCGEGGALLINDPSFTSRAEILREKGTNRARFFRGEVDKYSWVDLGSSYLPSDLLAAFLLAQLEAAASIQERRRHTWESYHAELAPWAARNGIGLAETPAHCDQAWHLFRIMLPDLASRTRFIAHMRARGVFCVFHYVPLHLSEMGKRFGGRAGQCPVAEDAADRLVRLPLYNSLSDADRQRVVEAAAEFEA